MKSSPRRQGRNQLRIIGGKWRGRKLEFPSVEGLRPTGDRIRETLFNWLAPTVYGARVLDPFAGSGALGLEALSRGAGSLLMIDNDAGAVERLQAHCHTLGAEHATIVQADALNYLQRGAQDHAFDLIFLDPPFHSDLLDSAVAAIGQGNWLAPEALVYLETDRDSLFSPPPNWELSRQKSAGQVSYSLYHYRRD